MNSTAGLHEQHRQEHDVKDGLDFHDIEHEGHELDEEPILTPKEEPKKQAKGRYRLSQTVEELKRNNNLYDELDDYRPKNDLNSIAVQNEQKLAKIREKEGTVQGKIKWTEIFQKSYYL